MKPRTIPQIVPKGVRPKATLQFEEKPKPPASDSDEYGDDFEVIHSAKIIDSDRLKKILSKKSWRVTNNNSI